MESERNEMDIRPFEKEEDEISPPLPDPNADHFETGRVSVAADWYYAVDERIKRLEKRLKERSFTALSEAFTASATIKRLEDWVKRLEKESREKDEKLENAQVAIRSYVAILAKRDATVESQRETIRLLQLAIDDDVLVLLTKKCAELEAKLSREKANAEHARSGMKAARAGRDQAFDKLEKLTNTPEAENLLQALNNSTKNLNEQIAQISRLHDKLRKMRKACSQLNKAVDRKNMRIAQLESKGSNDLLAEVNMLNAKNSEIERENISLNRILEGLPFIPKIGQKVWWTTTAGTQRSGRVCLLDGEQVLKVDDSIIHFPTPEAERRARFKKQIEANTKLAELEKLQEAGHAPA